MDYQISMRHLALLLGVGICFAAQPADAQSMFRCGNTYQDSPCQNAPASKTFNSTTGSKSASTTPAPVTDVQCSGRGAEALKLTWQREAGKTLEQQLNGVTSPTQRALIEETYSIRASAPEVRTAIEQACVKRKEEAAKVAALIEAAKASNGAARPSASVSGATSAVAQQEQAASIAKPKDRADAAGQPCESIQTQLSRIKDQQRQGGSISVQEDLNAQRRDLERRASAAKC